LSTTDELVIPLAGCVLAAGAAAKPVAEKPSKNKTKAARTIEISTIAPLEENADLHYAKRFFESNKKRFVQFQNKKAPLIR
jgi:flagellar basal body rod protein FlgC